MLLCCILIISCSNENEENNLSVIGTWNVTTLIEDAKYTDLDKEKHNEVWALKRSVFMEENEIRCE